MTKSRAYPFGDFNIYRKKKGVCHICGEDMYYGIGVKTVGDQYFNICRRCGKKIIFIRLSKWCN